MPQWPPPLFIRAELEDGIVSGSNVSRRNEHFGQSSIGVQLCHQAALEDVSLFCAKSAEAARLKALRRSPHFSPSGPDRSGRLWRVRGNLQTDRDATFSSPSLRIYRHCKAIFDTTSRRAAPSSRPSVLCEPGGSQLALNGKADGQDEDLVPFLDGNVVAAGLHFGHFQDDLSVALLHQRGLVVVLVIGKEDRRDGILAQVFAGQGDAVVHLARGRGDGGYFRGILSAGAWRQAEQENYRDKADLQNHTSTGRPSGSVLHP